jgi:hypothetical protein
MKFRETGQKKIRIRRVASGGKRQAKLSARPPSDQSLDTSSPHALIEALRGKYEGDGSLAEALERDRRRDDRAKDRKLAARYGR